MQKDDIIHGFRLIYEKDVPETNSLARLFLHEKSGAHLFHLENDDDNKVFYIAFATPPTDDTGTPHIIEHSVLCGSRKYPLKEPFVELVKGSLNTFLNAMTSPDKTVYPVASRNERDFQNLMDVYLDAVFYPNLLNDPFTLMQEGWHYEQENEDSPLKLSGVVFNEMKGALSDPEGLLSSRTMAHLYPGNAYRFESGGDPKAIPELTQEKFVEFHRRHYHPSNSLLYLYGDMDIDEKLKYLDENYLRHFSRIELVGKVTPQETFSALSRVRETYPIGQEENDKEKTFLTLNFMLDKDCSHTDMLAADMLSHALFKAEGAPVRQALIDGRIGSDADANLEGELLQPMFSVTVMGAEEENTDKFYDLLMKKLAELAEGGISRSLLRATVAMYEFRLREADFGHLPKGLVYGLRSLTGYFYGRDLTEVLRYEESLAVIKAGIDENYFEKLLKKYLINNPHRLLLTMSPDKDLAARRENDEAARLKKAKEQMSATDLSKIRQTAEELRNRQAAPDSPEALATIPLLNLSDIKKTVDDWPLKEREESQTKVLASDVKTNGIAYLSFFFDALTVPQEKICPLYFLSDVIGAVGTKQHDYAELDELINLNTGGLDASLTVMVQNEQPDTFAPKFLFQSKTLTEKLPQTCDLLSEILTETVFTDKKRLLELALQEISEIETSFQRTAQTIVAQRIAADLTPAGRYAYEGILPFYRFLKDLTADFDNRFDELAEDLTAISKIVFNRRNLITSVTLPEKDYSTFTEPYKNLVAALNAEVLPAQNYAWRAGNSREGLMNAGQVQYVGKGANFIKSGFKYTGNMQVLATILRYDYFWTRIRVQGGAYGAFANFGSNGSLNFGSYRDPHLKSTVNVFDETADFIRNFAASEREMTKFIIGTMSGIDAPKTPKMKGYAAADAYLRGITKEKRQMRRDEVLATTPAKIRELAEVIDACMKENHLCVFGGEDKLKENAELFTSLTQVSL